MHINLNIIYQNLLFLFVVIYFSQGAIYPSGSLIAKISLFFILIISLFFLIKSLFLKGEKSLFYYSWIFLFILNLIGFILVGNYEDIYFSQIRNISAAILPFYPFYYFARKGCVDNKKFIFLFLVLFPIAILNFYYSRITLLSMYSNGRENVVSNAAYFFVAILPFLFLWERKRILPIISLIILLFFIIQGAKRGALITGVAGMLVYFIYLFKTVDPKERAKGVIFSIIAVILIFISFYHFYLSNEYLMNRFDNVVQNTTNRDIIYNNLWNNWYHSDDLIKYLFGFGFASTIMYSGTGLLAHNDWLELLTNFGLLGILIYTLLFCSMIHYVFFSKAPLNSKYMMLAILIIWLLKTLFSMFYTVPLTLTTSMLLGYLYGSSEYKRYLKLKL